MGGQNDMMNYREVRERPGRTAPVRFSRAWAESGEAMERRARPLNALVALLCVHLLVALALAFAFAGCTTIPETAVKSLRQHVATGRANLGDWDKLDADQKKHCYWNQIRLNIETLHAIDGTDLGEFAVSPWDKSAPATADAITLPSDASK